MKMMLSALLLATLLTISLSSVDAAEVGDSCRTACRRDGTCVVLSECPNVEQLFHLKVKPAWVERYMTKALCGSNVGAVPVVCCPPQEPDIDLRTPSLPATE